MHPIRLSFLIIAGVAVAACTRPVDTAAEERAIRQFDGRWVDAVAARDTMAIGDIYADDAEFLAPNAPRVTGRAAIRTAWAQFLRAPNLSLRFSPTKVWVSSSADLAYETGPYRLSFDGPKGKPVADTGKFVEAWRRVNGVWKVQYNIFNSDNAPM